MVAGPLRSYSDYLRANASKALYTYTSHARLFLRWLASKNLLLAKLTAQQVNDYLCHRRSSGRRAQTVKDDLIKVRHFLRYARQQGLISNDPTQAVSCRWL